MSVVLLVAFGVLFLYALAGDRLDRYDATPIAAIAGLCALVVGIALLAGHPFAHDYGYLQALGPAVGVSLLVYALARRPAVSRHAVSVAAFAGVAVILVSVFWATSEYADSRGRAEAKRLASDLTVDPSATIFSKENLSIDPLGPGGGVQQPVQPGGGCPLLQVKKFRTGAYRFAYSGFTLLLRSDGKYFLTPTPIRPGDPWDPANDAVFVIPDDGNVRIELTRGVDYAPNPVEETANGPPTFTC